MDLGVDPVLLTALLENGLSTASFSGYWNS